MAHKQTSFAFMRDPSLVDLRGMAESLAAKAINAPNWPDKLARGAHILGAGAAKVVYSLPGGQFVLKISKGFDWNNQLETEVDQWENAPADLRAVLAPIVAYDPNYRWSIQRRAIAPHDKYWSDDGFARARTIAQDFGIGDFSADNSGYIDGKPVIVDYGIS